MFKKIEISILIIVLASVVCQAQNTPTAADPLERHLISPELIMQNQHAIELSDQQRTSIVEAMTTAQAAFTEYHWDLQNEMQKLATFLAEPQIEEEKALEQLAEVLAKESQIKRAQMGMMIRIKNYLTEEQQSILQEIKKSSNH